MTIAVDLGRKATKQTKKQPSNKSSTFLEHILKRFTYVMLSCPSGNSAMKLIQEQELSHIIGLACLSRHFSLMFIGSIFKKKLLRTFTPGIPTYSFRPLINSV